MTSLAAPLSLSKRARTFESEAPHTAPPFSKRSWGHSLHSLCSYQGKMKPSLAHFIISWFVPPGATVLDPLGGVGTIPFEAALSGRRAISNDMSPLATVVTRGKLGPPTVAEADNAIDRLASELETATLHATDYETASFGLNASVRDYYHADTLDDVLRARKLFLSQASWSGVDAFVWACLLHILHGNRPYALSRTSHPITPFAPTGPVVKKDLVASLRAKAARALADPLPGAFRAGDAYQGDFRDLPKRGVQADVIVTSPPFLGMRFDRPNWLRLWFCGWTEATFHGTAAQGYLERQQTRDRQCYSEFFQTCSEVLTEGGLLIVHVGSGPKGSMSSEFPGLASRWFELDAEVTEDVRQLERHGVPDKRLTQSHHLLFFVRS